MKSINTHSVTLKLLLFFAFISALNLQARDYYVSKSGKDTNAGTLAAPFLTISKAASIAAAGDIVHIREGNYEETLTPKNSGAAGRPIVFQSYAGEKVIISAMQALNNWTQDTGSIYKTKVDWDLGQRNFVMHDKKVLDLARWPNNIDGDPFTFNSVRNEGGSGGNVSTNAFLTDRKIPNWDWAKGGSILFYGDRPGSGWTTWKAYIKGSSSGRINFDLIKNQSWIRTAHPPKDKGDYFLEGIKQALDYQNEWFFEASSKTLYVQLPNGAAPANGVVKMARRQNTINLKRKNYIEIRNLAVFGGNIEIDGAGNKLYGVSNFYGSMTRGITPNFNSGVNAINIGYSSSKTIIEKCEVAFGDGTGIWDSGAASVIKNCYVHDFDMLGSYDAPVMIRGKAGSKLLNNTITRGGRDGLQIISKNSEVAYNDISASNLLADDCGLIYQAGDTNGMEIHHNWLHDAYSRGRLKKAAGIYLDVSPVGVKVHHNVVWNTEWTSIQMNWDANNVDIFNNTFVKGVASMGAWHKAGTKFTNVKVWNNITDKTGGSAGGQESEFTWEPQSNKQNNLISKESFVNWTGNDFHLKPNSKAVDFGRIIEGTTNNYKGARPDVGAYELGENWVPGINWNKANGPNNTCYGLPGETCNGSGPAPTPTPVTPVKPEPTPVANNDKVSFATKPTSLETAKEFTFKIDYEAFAERDLVLEFWNATTWIAAKTVKVQKGKAQTSVSITLPNNPAKGKGYIVKTYIKPVGTDWKQTISLDQINNLEITEPVVVVTPPVVTPPVVTPPVVTPPVVTPPVTPPVVTSPTTPTPVANTGLLVHYKEAGGSRANDNSLNPHFRILNSGKTNVNYSDLTIKYWFSKDSNAAMNLWVDWAQIGNKNVSHKFGTDKGMDYVELSFAASLGQLNAGNSSGDIQTRMAKANWSNFNEANDYSYNNSIKAYAENNKVTLYQNGKLIWGTEPIQGAKDFDKANLGLVISPNPANSYTNVSSKNDNLSNSVINVLDLSGKIVFATQTAANENTVELQTSSFSTGVYLIKVTNSEGKTQIQKLVVE